jgi:arylsulfatase A-like enzyme
MATRLNVIDLIADQHQAACLGCEGHPQVLTPNLDRFAEQGVRCTSAYTQNPICTPSRVSVFSGQYCHNHGYYGLSGPRPAALPSYFSHFKSQGYRTAGIGNMHTPCAPRNWLENHLDLFDDSFESVDGIQEQTAWYDRIRERGLLEKEDFHFTWAHPELGMEGMPSQISFEDSQEGWCVESAMRFMEASGQQPFCMQVSFERPHHPVYPDGRFWEMYPEDLDLPPTLNQDPSGRPPHFREAYDRFHAWQGTLEPHGFTQAARRQWRAYLACITQVDYAVGLLLDYLERTGLAENTVVVYHADHGAYCGTYGIQEKAPGICSEAVCRIPYIWRVPGVTPAGHVTSQFVENVDLAPTFAALCGLPPMETVDGLDLSPLLRGEDAPVREVAVTEHPWSKALRWGSWRFVHYQPDTFPGEEAGELYDLAADPQETRNLYREAEYQPIVEQSRRLLLEWTIRTTRATTVWPPRSCAALNDPQSYDFATTGDGKESNQAGAALRAQRGETNYL